MGPPRRLTDRCPSPPQIFPLSPGSRWQSSGARPVALALQQVLGQELALVRQGSPEVTGVSVRLLQAIASLLNSPHGGALVMAMQRSHFLACPLMRQLCQYQVRAAGACLAREALASSRPRGPGGRTLPRGPRSRLLGEGREPGGPSSRGVGPALAGRSGMSVVRLPLGLARCHVRPVRVRSRARCFTPRGPASVWLRSLL